MRDTFVPTVLFLLTLLFVGLSFFAGNINLPNLIHKLPCRATANPTAVTLTSPTPADNAARLLASLRQASPSALTVVEQSDRIYLLNKETSQSAQIAQGRSPSLSPDGRFLAYVKMDVGKSVYLQDIQTGTESTLPVQGEKAASITTVGGKILWLDDQHLVFDAPVEVSPPRPYGSGEGVGIDLLTLPTGKTTVLFKPDALKDYKLERVDDGKIIFSRRLVKNPDDWNDPTKPVTTFWQVSPDASGLKPL